MSLLLLLGGALQRPPGTPAFVITGHISGLVPLSRKRFREIQAALEAAKLAELKALELAKEQERLTALAAIAEAQAAILEISERKAETAAHEAISDLAATLSSFNAAPITAAMRRADEIAASAEAIRAQLDQEDEDDAIAMLLLSHDDFGH